MQSSFNSILKRTLDVVASSIGILLLAPLGVAIAIAIKLDSPGPVLFRQQRVGHNFRLFHILKFRTMVDDAEKTGKQITAAGDTRVTRVGSLLRTTKLDEFPQLINVLFGDMSLVGPRPEVPRYVKLFEEDYQEILRVRPGITDMASIQFCDEAQLLDCEDPESKYVNFILPNKITLAKKYVERNSVVLDAKIILRTFLAIAVGQSPSIVK